MLSECTKSRIKNDGDSRTRPKFSAVRTERGAFTSIPREAAQSLVLPMQGWFSHTPINLLIYFSTGGHCEGPCRPIIRSRITNRRWASAVGPELSNDEPLFPLAKKRSASDGARL